MHNPTLYYVRHGMTDWNSAGRLQGHDDQRLNPEGHGQAVRCGEILRALLDRGGRHPDDLDYVSSPLVRARETMDRVRTKLGLAATGYRVDPRLAEISFGEWEGLTYAEVVARDGDVVARRETDKWQFRPPGGENYAELAGRVSAWHESLQRDAVVSAHGGTARALIAVRGIAPPDHAVHHPIDHGVVYVFEGDRLTRID
jgi:broad specificity phosphatase PhoE